MLLCKSRNKNVSVHVYLSKTVLWGRGQMQLFTGYTGEGMGNMRLNSTQACNALDPMFHRCGERADCCATTEGSYWILEDSPLLPTLPRSLPDHSSPTPCPWQPPFYFLSLNLTTLRTSCKWNPVVFVLISLSIVSSRFVHVVTSVKIPILFKSELYSIVCIGHILFFYSSINGHTGEVLSSIRIASWPFG